MACGGMGGCGGGSSSNKTSNHAPKKMPNWGMKPIGAGSKNYSGSSSFGSPKVKMSFSGKSRRGY